MLPEIGRERLERSIGGARIIGGLLAVFIGPFLPGVAGLFVIAFGVLVAVYGLLAARFDRRGATPEKQLRSAWILSIGDAAFGLLVLLVFASDPEWVIAPAVLALIIVCAFRLGPVGALFALIVNTAGYLGGAVLRSEVFGYPTAWPQIAMLIGMSALIAALLAGVLHNSESLRSLGRDLYRPLLEAQSQLGELIVVTEGDRAVYVSRALTTLTGYTEAELRDVPIRELFVDVPRDEAAVQVGTAEGGALREVVVKIRDGTRSHLDLATSELPLRNGVPRTLFIARDASERRAALGELDRLAIHDGLTGLPNRGQLRERLGRLLATLAPGTLAVLYFDMHRFKDFNDAFGHEGGDELLRELAARLNRSLGPRDLLARYEGDKFVVVLGDTLERPGERAEALLGVIAGSATIRGQLVHPEATVGISIAPAHGSDAETLINRAEAAMYHAKRARLRVGVYEPRHDQNVGDRLALQDDLRRAIEHDQLALHFQPILDMATGQCVNVECLIRWHHATRGWVPPVEFIPVAEESGLIRRIGIWVLNEGLRTGATWPQGGPGMSVNMSMRNLAMPELLAEIEASLLTFGTARGGLTIEITESLSMEQPQRITALLGQLEKIGVRTSIDDYGSGFSSLAYLKQLPVHDLKVDRAFVDDVTTNPQSAAIVRSTIELGHRLGMLVVAEGIEDQATWDALRDLGCDRAQGYFIARPMPADALRTWLRARAALAGSPDAVPGAAFA